MRRGYVHGHHRRERQRLQDQAGALVDLLHGDTKYPKGSGVLEAGCGVGAQTVTLARRSPGAAFVSIDVSEAALAAAGAASQGRRECSPWPAGLSANGWARGSTTFESRHGWCTWMRVGQTWSRTSPKRPSSR
jgi:SAM-dependent methyltransferase